MERTEEQQGVSFGWDKSPEIAAAAARFAARVIGADSKYISHGEIQTGLSPDGRRWSPELAALYAEDFADLGDARDLLIARNTSGEMVGIAILAWEETARRRFAVLEDMAVDPTMRSRGIGAKLLEMVADRVRERRYEWLFLESGVENHGAHAFFERHGFRMISHVFATRP